jgi:hypothetical protein
MKEPTKTGRKQDTFTIRGRLAAAEGSRNLGGLKVIATLAHTKQRLGEVTTGPDGSFTLEFRWHEPVDVEIAVAPDVDEAVMRTIPKASRTFSKEEWVKKSPYTLEIDDWIIAQPIWKLWDEVCKTYTVFGMVVKGVPDPHNPGTYLELIPIPDATVHIYDVNPSWFWILPPGHTRRELGTATTDVNGLFVFTFEWCYTIPYIHLWWWPSFPDTKPDLLFEVTQTVNGTKVSIYDEDPATETRWDINNLPPLGVTLIVEEDVVLPDDPISPISDDFEFHGIGRVLVSQINSEGYASTAGAGDVVGAHDSPFGSTLDIKGQFNNAHAGKFYQVLYARWADDTTPPTAGDFGPMLDESWPIAQKVGTNWVTVMRSPVSLPGAGEGCYQIPDYTDLYTTSKEILIRWTTYRKDVGAPRYPDGKYTLKIKAFNADGSDLPLPAGGTDEIIVRIDNSWPVASLQGTFSIVGGTLPLCPNPKPAGMICDSPQVCGIVYIEPGKQVRIGFDAYDNQDHFRNYQLSYRTGHGVAVAIPGGSKQFIGPPREDHGFIGESVDWSIAGLAQCGYEVRLVVWDRTINGYHHIHWSEDFVHVILLEKPAP